MAKNVRCKNLFLTYKQTQKTAKLLKEEGILAVFTFGPWGRSKWFFEDDGKQHQIDWYAEAREYAEHHRYKNILIFYCQFSDITETAPANTVKCRAIISHGNPQRHTYGN